VLGKKIKDFKLRYLRYKYPLDAYPAGFDRYKCVFFHIPKAAGTSICLSMFGHQVGHLTFNQLYYSNPQKISEYYKFTFVRNPWARLVSAYQFLSQGGMNSADSSWASSNLEQFDGFEDFVMRWISEDNINSYIHFIPQYKFITDRNGVIRADFVGKTENIDSDFQIVKAELGLKSTLLHSNKSQNSNDKKHYTDYYNDEMQRIVASVYERDIELFGYSFGE